MSANNSNAVVRPVLRLLRKLVANHSDAVEAVKTTVDAYAAEFPDATKEDSGLVPCLRMTVMSSVFKNVTDRGNAGALHLLADALARFDKETPAPEIRAGMITSELEVLDAVMNKGCDDAVREMVGDMSGFMQKRAASLEAKKKKSAEEEAEAEQRPSSSPLAKKTKKKSKRSAGDEEEGADTTSAPPSSEQEHAVPEEELNDASGRLTPYELATLSEAKRVARDYAALSFMGKKMFECFLYSGTM